MNNIIVNADDFGSRPSANNAIAELFDQGLLNSTTLMANMPGFEEAIELAHRHNITNRIGVHLVLTAGKPLTDEIRSLPYLFNKDSREGCIRKLFMINKSQKALIFNEFSRQIEKVKKNGIQITHLDTHKHLHEVWGVMQILAELLKVHKIPSMRILLNLEKNKYYKTVYRNIVNNYLRSKKINYSDYFGSRVDFLLAKEKDPDFTQIKTVEIMVHPDYNAKGQIVDFISKTEYDFSYLKT